MKRSLSLALALCVALLSLAGCSGSKAEPKVDNTPRELTLLLWPTISREAIDEVIYAYNQKHPNVRIKVSQSGQAQRIFGGGGQALDASVLDGIDIAILPRTQAAALARAGALRDLSAVRLPTLNDGVAHLYDDVSKLDGKRFGLPVDFTPSMMTLNAQVFTGSGLKAPGADWTLQEFEQALQALKSAGQTVQITPAALLAPIVGAYGGKLYDPHTQQWQLDTDAAKQGLAYIGRLTQAGLIPAASTGGGGVVIIGGGPGGQGGGQGQGRNFPAITALPGGFNVRGFGGGPGGQQVAAQQPYPKGPAGRSVPVSATMAVATAQSAHGEVAVDFIRQMLSDEAMQTALAKSGIRPVIASSKALAAWQDTVGDKAAQILESSLEGGHADLGTNYTDVLTALTPFFEGKATLDQVLPDLIAKLK